MADRAAQVVAPAPSAQRPPARHAVRPNVIERKFGTHRGLVRLALSLAQFWRGAYAPYARVDWSRVERLVFVCAGNVCRSPYGHRRAQQEFARVASMGLSTDTGRPADPQAIRAAARRQIDLDTHRATSSADFAVLPGDLFLIMEDRHLKPIQAYLLERAVPGVAVALLGLWARPRRPLIYDPMDLSDLYFDACYATIDSAVAGLLAEFRAARPEAFRK